MKKLTIAAIAASMMATAIPASADLAIPLLSYRTGPYAPNGCLLYTSPSPRDLSTSRMPSSA